VQQEIRHLTVEINYSVLLDLFIEETTGSIMQASCLKLSLSHTLYLLSLIQFNNYSPSGSWLILTDVITGMFYHAVMHSSTMFSVTLLACLKYSRNVTQNKVLDNVLSDNKLVFKSVSHGYYYIREYNKNA
jgi:hypothetical protein